MTIMVPAAAGVVATSAAAVEAAVRGMAVVVVVVVVPPVRQRRWVQLVQLDLGLQQLLPRIQQELGRRPHRRTFPAPVARAATRDRAGQPGKDSTAGMAR